MIFLLPVPLMQKKDNPDLLVNVLQKKYHSILEMHLLARMSIWMQILPYQMSDILSKDPFDYKGIEWIKKLMYLFHKYPNIDQMNNHFMEIAKIVAENFSLSREEIWEKVS